MYCHSSKSCSNNLTPIPSYRYSHALAYRDSDGYGHPKTYPHIHKYPSACLGTHSPADGFPLLDDTSQCDHLSHTFSIADHSTLAHGEPDS